MRKKKAASGEELLKLWAIPAVEGHFSQESKFYLVPEKFPAALCDLKGFVVFSSLKELMGTSGVKVTQRVNIRRGIFSLSKYTQAPKPIPAD